MAIAPPWRTQAQRRETTRSRILDATVQSLVERGHAETTSARMTGIVSGDLARREVLIRR